MTPNITELSLLDRWQRNFPLVGRPFSVAGEGFGLSETATIDTFRRLQAGGLISRIGAAVRPWTVGASTLAAMRVPPDRLEAVAAIVSSEPCVNHNYERTHQFNLWFVAAGPSETAISSTVARIERRSGVSVMCLPLVESYHVDLGFSLGENNAACVAPHPRTDSYRADSLDRELLAAIEDGLPIVAQPYREIAEQIDLSEDALLVRLQKLIASGIVTRFGCIVRHRALGYTANAMAVWDIPDDMVDNIANDMVRERAVTLCYRRPRHPPEWSYNLFCMVHAKSRDGASEVIGRLNRIVGSDVFPHDVLFSTRCFKQRGAKYSQTEGAVH